MICLIAVRFVLKSPCFKLVEKNAKNEKACEKGEGKCEEKKMMLSKPLSKHENEKEYFSKVNDRVVLSM